MKRENISGKTIVVVGGGAAGLMAAGTAVRAFDANVIIVEKNSRMARKVMITGKGRCNITNNCSVNEFIENVPTNGKFLYSAISNFTPQNMIDLLSQHGVALKTERGNRVFPQSNKAADVVDGLVKYARTDSVKTVQGVVSSLIVQEGACVGVMLDSGSEILSEHVIVATGGKSYPLTGSDGGGYFLAKQVGHTVKTPTGSLVPLETTSPWCMDLQGLSLKNCGFQLVSIKNGKRTVIFTAFGEMLFTHFGVSGPMVISASTHIKEDDDVFYEIIVDLKPALDDEKLDNRIVRDINENVNKSIVNMLGGLLPKTMCPVMCAITGIPPNKKCNTLSKEERFRLVKTFKALKIGILGKRPIEEAIVTSGGVSVDEIDSKTMKSKLVKGLSFAGEVIDVDAYTGGFNLQIAFSTGVLAGKHALNNL